jgi:hypothetical protein
MELRRGFDYSGQRSGESAWLGVKRHGGEGLPLSHRFARSGAVDERSGHRREVTNHFEFKLLKVKIL